MHADTLVQPRPEAKPRLRLFTLYADFHAGVRAKRVMHQLAQLARDRAASNMEMWKLDSVAPVGMIREMIAQEAGESDVLVIAMSDAVQPEPALTQWLNSLVDWKANRAVPGLLIGLLGDGERPAARESWAVEQLAAFVRRTQMDLVWRSPEPDYATDSAWLEDPLASLLARHDSAFEGEIPVGQKF